MEFIFDLTRKTWSNGKNEEIIRVVLREKGKWKWGFALKEYKDIKKQSGGRQSKGVY